MVGCHPISHFSRTYLQSPNLACLAIGRLETTERQFLEQLGASQSGGVWWPMAWFYKMPWETWFLLWSTMSQIQGFTVNIWHDEFVVLYRNWWCFERGWSSKHAWFLGPILLDANPQELHDLPEPSQTLRFLPYDPQQMVFYELYGMGVGKLNWWRDGVGKLNWWKPGNPFAYLHCCAFLLVKPT